MTLFRKVLVALLLLAFAQGVHARQSFAKFCRIASVCLKYGEYGCMWKTEARERAERKRLLRANRERNRLNRRSQRVPRSEQRLLRKIDADRNRQESQRNERESRAGQ